MNPAIRRTATAAAILVLGAAVQVGLASGAEAVKPKPFVITKITPSNQVTITIPGLVGAGSPKKTQKIHWSGTAVFPLTVTVTPEPTCSTVTPFNFTCNTHTQVFASGTKALSLSPTFWYCTVNATSAGSHTGIWDLTITDANGQVTASVPDTEICQWGGG